MNGLDAFVRFLLLPGALFLIVAFIPTAVRDIKDYMFILGLNKKPVQMERKKAINTFTVAAVHKNSFSNAYKFQDNFNMHVQSMQEKPLTKMLEG